MPATRSRLSSPLNSVITFATLLALAFSAQLFASDPEEGPAPSSVVAGSSIGTEQLADGATNCFGAFEVKLDEDVPSAQILAHRLDAKGRFVTRAAAEVSFPTEPERLVVAGGSKYRFEVFFSLGSDDEGQPLTFSRSLDINVACDQVISIDLTSKLSADNEGLRDGNRVLAARQPQHAAAASVIGRPAGDYLVTRPSGPASASETNLCTTDTFDSAPGLTSAWTFSFVGDADQGGAAEVSGHLRLTSDGSSLFHAPDHGGFLHQSVAGDFRARVTLTGFPSNTGGGPRKAGLTVRTGTGSSDPRVFVMYVPNNPTFGQPALQFDFRNLAGVTSEVSSTVLGVALPVQLMIDRRGDTFKVYYSTDGLNWTNPLGAAGGQVTIAMGPSVEVGMMQASYSTTTTMTSEFDNFALCSPNTDPPAPPPPPISCEPGKPLDLIYLLDTSGSMTLPYSAGSGSKLDAAAAAITAMNNAIEANIPGSRSAVVGFSGSFDQTYNLTESVRILAPLSTDLDASAAAVLAINQGAISPSLTTTPAAIAFDRLLDIMNSSLEAAHQPIVVWMTDGVPNIDINGFGPLQYALAETDILSLKPGGVFRSWGATAWLGNYNGGIDTYDGEVLANAMSEIEQLKAGIPDVIVHGVAIQSNVNFREDLIEYSSYHTGGSFVSAANATELVDALVALVNGHDCGATIGDRVWNDLDGDGVQDGGEPGLENVTVELRNADGDVIATEVTDSNGNYLFENVPAGTYTVVIDVSSLPDPAFEATFDLDGIGTPHSTAVTVVDDQEKLDVDFGYRLPPPATIGDRVWNDLDGDGFQDGGEPGLVGVTVELVDGTNTVIATQVTGANGIYTFTNVVAGSYTVRVVPAGLGAVNAPTFDFDGIASANTAAVTVAAGDTQLAVDFGYREPAAATIGDRVWNDLDGDGLQEGGEPGLVGVTVELVDASNTVIATQITGANGIYNFTNVAAGTYTVRVINSTLPDGINQPTFDRDGIATANTAVVTVTNGQTVTDVDFGYVCPNPATIGDRVWNDLDGDGVQDGGEPGLVGATVELLDASNTVIATQVTGANGIYTFNNLNPGTYTVRVVSSTLPSGINQPTFDRDGIVTAHRATVSVVAGQTVNDVDFGYICPNPATIGDRVWKDVDGDGVQDSGEPGISGVTVQLLDASNTVIATKVTTSSGAYTFTGLNPGTYTVKVVSSSLPNATYTPTFDFDGVATAHVATVTVTAGQNQLAVDFGYTCPTGKIGDRVWDDKDRDGVQDSGETGIEGVTVQLLNSANVVIATDVTDWDGKYDFTGLAAGTYTVRVLVSTLPSGIDTATYDFDGLGSLNQATVTITNGQVQLAVDFGYTEAPEAWCPRTPGYWKNHPEVWPVSSLVIGGVTYNTSQLMTFLNYGGNDASTRLARHLTATMLNLAMGSDPWIQGVVNQANAFLVTYPPGSNPRGSARNTANSLKDKLDKYNNDSKCH